MSNHHDLVEYQGVKASACSNTVEHRPRPKRFVWHHVLPLVCGGKTQARNLVQLCDNCHYSVHIGLWTLQFAHDTFRTLYLSKDLANYAAVGWNAALIAGTANLIPKEA